MEILMLAVLLMAGGNLLCALAVWRLVRQEREAPPVQEESAAEGPRSLRLDEGFENLMAYQVKLGRGQVTGGAAE